ncbi:MAG TPA: toll/interleukin-1 receptor domain-containing protein [Novosphingobium sp.]|nr:toll/interleukin-1 receptor domain-containing protein [Novosphingobium sp.]
MTHNLELAGVGAHFRAFISYSHADAKFAHWLHRRLENFRMAENGELLRPIFIDHAELVAGGDLSAQVRDAIARSEALIVVASPAARDSRWVAQEIALFRELHPDRPILAALHRGEPGAAFPEALLAQAGAAVEPLAADFRRKQDGRRLALLKIVAGLTGVPLDRLVHRDAQARQRRVMAVTAFAVLIILVLAILLLAAIRARAEAERRRAETEGMVEFMLTDLRQKLKGVGRLEIMSTVNERAMAHYAGERDLRSLPAETLERRARLLQAMTEDDLQTTGEMARGQSEAAEAYRVTEDLLRREPDNTDRIFNHAQSEYWVGYAAYLRRDFATTEKHWQTYRTLAERLVAIDPAQAKWQRELAYAEGNLCARELAEPADPIAALPYCVAARNAMERVATGLPHDLDARLDLANRYAWQADALAGAGDIAGALDLRRHQKLLVTAAAREFPKDARVDEARLLAEIGLGRALMHAGRGGEARAAAAQASEIAELLHRKDPANQNWAGWNRLIAGIAAAQ